jgi:tetrahydromethanopterin S-methyltransferase subunit G
VTQTNIENLMLEQFRRLDRKLDLVVEEVRELKTLALGHRHVIRSLELASDASQDSLSNIKARLERVERRLELADGEPPKAAE